MTWVAMIGLLAFVAIVYFLVEASRRLLEIHVERGRVLKLEGRAPNGAVGDLQDIFTRNRSTGAIVVRLEAGRVVAQASDSVDANTAQQVRNVVGRFPAAKWKAGRRVKR